MFFHIKPVHCVTTLLAPRMKTGVLSMQEKLDAVAVLREMMAEVSTEEVSPATSTLPAAKRIKMEDDSLQSDFFDDLFDTANSESLPVDETDQYLNSTVYDGNILTYWQNKEDIWPKLSQCAK